ncbi:MAG TPA: gamma-glutamylcyclotransferase [Longimicrobium sp.]|nr:gamma-glutamylcyclotransferase [Longimicrobium sp.]
MEPALAEVIRLVAAANAARGWGDGAPADPDAADADRRLDALFRIRQTLAVYGTLAPGRPNHHIVAPLAGTWTEGVVEGDLYAVGWGAAHGYPAFIPRPGGPAVPVSVLTAPMLASAWPELDDFEGPGYRRILVPVFSPGPPDERRLHTVANLYAAAEPPPDAAAR